MNIVAAPHSFVRLKVAPSTPGIGAEISGIDLACEQDDATIAEIRAALLAYKVVFFRDQFITAEQPIAFARRSGPLDKDGGPSRRARGVRAVSISWVAVTF